MKSRLKALKGVNLSRMSALPCAIRVYDPSVTVRQTTMRILKRPIRCRKEIGSGIPNAIAVAGSVVEQRDTAKELYQGAGERDGWYEGAHAICHVQDKEICRFAGITMRSPKAKGLIEDR